MNRGFPNYSLSSLLVLVAVGLFGAVLLMSAEEQQDNQPVAERFVLKDPQASSPQASSNIRSVTDDNALLVFAAASLGSAMAEIVAEFERVHGHRATVALAGSSALARQIEHGAPADVFMSADIGWMDRLEQQGLIDVSSRDYLLGNRLDLIEHGVAAPLIKPGFAVDSAAPSSFAKQLQARLNNERLALALVDAVPAGIYAKAVFQSLEIWEQMKGNVVQTDHVRAALTLVATGEARYGIVYATDVVQESQVSIISVLPHQLHPEIVYPVARTRASRHAQALPFVLFLQGASAQQIFERHGFSLSRL